MDHSWVETQFNSTLAHIAHTCHSDSLVTLIEPMSVCLFYSMPLSSAFNCTGNITWTKYATKHASQCVPIWLGFGSRYINLLPNTTNFWFVFEKLSGEIDLKTNKYFQRIFALRPNVWKPTLSGPSTLLPVSLRPKKMTTMITKRYRIHQMFSRISNSESTNFI